MAEHPKILVFTVTSWNSKVGSNTWSSLLNGHPSEFIANICIRDEVPDSASCSRYFLISENRMIKSVFNRKIKTGLEYPQNNTAPTLSKDLVAHNQRYIKMKKNRRYSMLLARELVWKVGCWRTPELDAFLDSFKPDIILHSMEGYIHLNRIIEYAIKRTGAKAVGYIWDDNFTYKQSTDLGYKIYRFFQRRSLKRLRDLSSDFFAISPQTKKEADLFFGIDSHLLTKPLLKSPVPQPFSGRTPIKMLYTGSLIIGRDRSLLRLSRALNEVNREQCKIELDVYTQTTLSDKELAAIENDYCHLHQAIPQQEALQKQNEADILLFLEDIDGKDSHVARLSFSTKITDYLSTGKCIFAVGNIDTAPMQYFLENDAAAVCKDDSDIVEHLKRLCSTPEIIGEYAKKAAEAAKRNHDPEQIRSTFNNVIASVLDDK